MRAGTKTSLSVIADCCCYEVPSVTWWSQNESIATVDQWGKVTAGNEKGSTEIWATARGFTAKCKITVDTRRLVRISKQEPKNFITGEIEEEYALVEFLELIEGEGRVWRSVGVDMELNENRTLNYHGQTMDIYNMDDKLLTKPEIRHKKNMEHVFSKDQLALLYRIDPYGVVFYVKEYCRLQGGWQDVLRYKDDVYRAIFTEQPNHFYFRVRDDGSFAYVSNYSDRTKVHSDAEVLFGAHKIIEVDFKKLVETAIQVIFTIASGYTSNGLIEFMNASFTFSELNQLLFFSGSVEKAACSVATNRIEEYVKLMGNKTMKKAFGWCCGALEAIKGFSDIVKLENAPNIPFCRSLKEDTNYLVSMVGKNGYYSLDQVISLMKLS
jgi:hypothetical protein